MKWFLQYYHLNMKHHNIIQENLNAGLHEPSVCLFLRNIWYCIETQNFQLTVLTWTGYCKLNFRYNLFDKIKTLKIFGKHAKIFTPPWIENAHPWSKKPVEHWGEWRWMTPPPFWVTLSFFYKKFMKILG